MEKEDGRRLSPDAQHERRKQVLRLHKGGHSRSEIARMTGLSYPGVTDILKRFETSGADALKPRQRGRRLGAQRRLSAEQERHVRRLICDKRPEQLKMVFALWNRGAVSQLITQEFGVELPVRTVGEYLKRWGFTPQKPIKRAYEQSPEAVQKWLDESYPAIARRAKEEDAEVHWGDETALVNTDVRGRGYAPKGRTPVAYAPAKREKLSMISTVTNQGKTRWMIVDGRFDADRLIEFLEALVKDANKKVFLILDNLRVHHSHPVKDWLAARKAQIEVFYLPSYSPELNPDERLNADLKYGIASKVSVRSKSKLQAVANDHMILLSNSPERVRTYFEDPRVKYAA